MGGIHILLRCPNNVNGIAADPEPDWSFDNLLSELDSIQNKLAKASSDDPAPSFTKIHPRKRCASEENHRGSRGFVMSVADLELDYSEEEVDRSIVSGSRFSCDEFCMSDDSEDESPRAMQQHHLMDKVGVAEGALCELANELQLNVSEEVRNKISSLESDLVDENEKSASTNAKIEKHREIQKEREKKIDLQHRRMIAEALDNHLTALQRDHEHISQLEERKIRDDAARLEAKRREKALQEEKVRQDKARAEEEARLRAEKAKAATILAEKLAAEEAEAKRAAAAVKDAAHKAAGNSLRNHAESTSSGAQISARNSVKASENALELEKRRRDKYEELIAKYENWKTSSSQDYDQHARDIFRRIKTISATVENIRKKADELVMLINSPVCPQFIGIILFAEKVVSYCTKQPSASAIYALSRVVVLVTYKIPEAMDIIIAELNKACIYTVPKHIIYSQAAYTTIDAYYRALGCKEVDGKIEDREKYLESLSSYMKFYGALVQTEVGVQNLHGLKEGWAWLARFLNSLPANLHTAVAVHSFLEMAGFALYRKYKNQFEKLLNVIARDYIKALRGDGGSESWNAKMEKITVAIESYIESRQYKKEPEGLQLEGHLMSRDMY